MDFHLGSINDIFAILITVTLSLAAFISSVMLYIYIYYSWVRRKNKEDQIGEDVAHKVFEKTGHSGVKIEKTIWFFKFWNYSKKNKVFKLRPWTYSRKSLWTLSEASQQAYLADIKAYKKDKHFSMYTFPLILRIISGVVAGAAVLIAIIAPFALPNADIGKDLILPYILIGAALWVIGSSIGSLAKSHEVRKNLVPLFKSVVSDGNAKAIQRIMFYKFLFALASLILAITSLPTLFAHIADVLSNF